LRGSTPLGGPLVGYIGEHVDPRAAVFVGGVAALVAAAYGWVNLRTAGVTDQPDARRLQPRAAEAA
jgi:hypothetical protein